MTGRRRKKRKSNPQSIRNPQSAIRNTTARDTTARDREHVTRRDQKQQRPVSREQRQILSHPADHRAQQVRAEVGRRRGRPSEAVAEEQAGAEDRAEDQQAVEDRLGRTALERHPSDRDQVIERDERQERRGDRHTSPNRHTARSPSEYGLTGSWQPRFARNDLRIRAVLRRRSRPARSGV